MSNIKLAETAIHSHTNLTLPVIMMAPSTGHPTSSFSVRVLLNIAGVEANLHEVAEVFVKNNYKKIFTMFQSG